MAENQEDFNSQLEFNSLKNLVLSLLDETIKTSKTLDSNFEILKDRLAKIEAKVDKLSNTTGEEFENVDGKLDNIQIELSKIEKVSRYTEGFEDLLNLSRLGKS